METINRSALLDNLSAFLESRPGLQPGNYATAADYRAEYRRINNDLKAGRRLLAAVGWRESITAGDILAASRRAYSGRLAIDPATGVIDYCTGQYYPTEYRRAVCAVLALALWDHARADHDNGDELRRYFRREFGANLGRRFFN